jgi:hypothetical protein
LDDVSGVCFPVEWGLVEGCCGDADGVGHGGWVCGRGNGDVFFRRRRELWRGCWIEGRGSRDAWFFVVGR